VNGGEKTTKLFVLVQEWTKRLKSCQYAGEVVVPEAELPDIAKLVHPEIFPCAVGLTQK
jgi:hypothetical protein